MDDLVINIATKNGTGSLSANQLLAKILFRAGWAPGAFNFFPSNIAGLPCLYSLRLNAQGWTGFSEKPHILLSLNPESLQDELKALDEKGLLISDEKDKIAELLTGAKANPQALPASPSAGQASAAPVAQKPAQQAPRGASPRAEKFQPAPPGAQARRSASLQNKGAVAQGPQKDFLSRKPLYFKGAHLSLPLAQSLREIEGLRPKTRPLFKNMIYVGLFCEWLKVKEELIKKTAEDFWGQSKGLEVVKKNLQAISLGQELARANGFPFSAPAKPGQAKQGSLVRQALCQDIASSSCPPFLEKPGEGAPSLDSAKGAPQPPGPQASLAPPGTAGDKGSGGLKARLAPQEAKALEEEDKADFVFIDGNTACALGALSAGCQFMSWYPITPASSLAESFERFANLFQKDKQGRKKFAVIQAEDEIGGICQAIGAGWAGLRAMTVTSGPGLSLMSEAAGLSYFAEIPLVLCNVQRAGPSTGLPTRTRQGDLLSACFLSHGDSKHIALLPGTPQEAFDLMAMAFDLAEELNTLIIVLSDLDLAMNLKVSLAFKPHGRPLKRGRVLREKDLKEGFQPYGDERGDGVSFRTLPGIRGQGAADFTRGSGHNAKGEYSERPEDCARKLEKLERKWRTARKLMPRPVVRKVKGAKRAFVTFGPNEPVVSEFLAELLKQGDPADYMRVLSFPFSASAGDFLKSYQEIFVVEQNRDGQLKRLLCAEFPHSAQKMKSILQYDGRPFSIESLRKGFKKTQKD